MIESKLFVVIIVLSTVLLGVAAYLFYLDRKTSKLEKQIRDKENER